MALAIGTAVLCPASDTAERYYKAGEQAQKAGDTLKAYLLFARAAQLDPLNATYAFRRMALQSAAPLASTPRLGPDPADETLGTALQAEGLLSGELSGSELTAPPPRLSGAPGKRSFDLRGEPQKIFDQVAGAYGIQVIFDSAYQAPPPLRFHIDDAGFIEALRALEAASDSFFVPLAEHLAMVVRDTAQKRTELMPVMSLAVPIPERISVQEAQEITTAVQQTMEIRRISMDPARRVVYFRDAVSKVLAARQMFANLARLRSQVEVDIEFLSVSSTSTLSYGLSLPTSASIVDFGTAFLNHPAVSGANFFALAGGGGTLLGLGIANAAAFATLSKASADTVLNAQIVALDGQPATLHFGDRYPVTTSSFSGAGGGVGFQNGGFAPTVQFEDLGLVLKLTPAVHENYEVTLDVDAQFKTLGTDSGNGIPVIGTRQYQGKVRLKDGEWAVIAGLVTTNDAESPTGIAGLMNIPWIGRLFSHQTHTKESTQTLIVLKPRLVALPPWETALKPIWTGTESRPITPF
ncbi:MAG TPA: type II and III secretion system protein [Bryobacteraceae bacterium]|nr:type II and III secretion system protein [Bryobacteraceae bacterium]